MILIDAMIKLVVIENKPNMVLKNISNHVKIDDLITHVTSSNNLCGFGFYKLKDDKMLLLGDQIRRNMLVEEFNIIQYNQWYRTQFI